MWAVFTTAVFIKTASYMSLVCKSNYCRYQSHSDVIVLLFPSHNFQVLICYLQAVVVLINLSCLVVLLV